MLSWDAFLLRLLWVDAKLSEPTAIDKNVQANDHLLKALIVIAVIKHNLRNMSRLELTFPRLSDS